MTYLHQTKSFKDFEMQNSKKTLGRFFDRNDLFLTVEDRLKCIKNFLHMGYLIYHICIPAKNDKFFHFLLGLKLFFVGQSGNYQILSMKFKVTNVPILKVLKRFQRLVNKSARISLQNVLLNDFGDCFFVNNMVIAGSNYIMEILPSI